MDGVGAWGCLKVGTPVRQPAEIDTLLGIPGYQQRLVFEELADQGGQLFDVGNLPTLREVVEGQSEIQLARRGDRGLSVGASRQFLRQPVGAVMAAQQRHRAGAVFGQGDDGGLLVFVAKIGGEASDDDPGGADADNGSAFLIERPEMRDGRGKFPVGALNAMSQPMHLGAGKIGAQPLREVGAALGQGDEDRCKFYRHQALPR